MFTKWLKETDPIYILATNPVPTNLNKVRKLDMYLHELMKDGKRKSELDLESTFEKLQQKLFDIMGPLGR